MCFQLFSLHVVDEGDVIVHSPLNYGFVKEFGVFLSILEPSDPRFLAP